MIQIRIAGVLGYETARRLLEEHREKLEKRFAGFFIRRIEELASRNLPEERIRQCSAAEGIYAASVGDGGLYAALWKACEDLDPDKFPWAAGYHGCEVDLESVPVFQEVTEVCELYGVDPFESPSAGAWLLILPEEAEREKLEPEDEKRFLYIQEQSAIIGKLTKKRRRVVSLGETVRYLTPPGRQQKDMANRKNEV